MIIEIFLILVCLFIILPLFMINIMKSKSLTESILKIMLYHIIAFLSMGLIVYIYGGGLL